MKLHPKHDHDLPGVGYWGERSEIKLRINCEVFKPGAHFPPDPLHFHTTRTTYFCVLEGSILVEVEGEEIMVTPDAALEIAPMEKYRVLGIGAEGYKGIVIGSHNEADRQEVV